ncbi:Heavy metal RND efflux outer membrane protein, CzcC family [hydrothermal vent metagenome]|uniref:Heavy metal RND efflux outer membrane protein, CzcC family n=1 Tax=hydrothermal vent metagenome TaxID=652676 RepID=A0A3B0YFQ9_9ZZZZ
MSIRILFLLNCCVFIVPQLLAADTEPRVTEAERRMSHNSQAPLALNEALALARQADLLYKREVAMAKSYKSQSIAVRRYPDPQIKLSSLNFPTDTFARDQEPMTQLKVGLKQAFPRGRTLHFRSQKAKLMSLRHDYLARDRRLRTIRGTRKAWLELWYWTKAEKIVAYNKVLFVRALRTTRDQYRTGKRRQEDIIRAQLELDLINDKLILIKTKQQQTRAILASWVGRSAAMRPLSKKIPLFKWIPDVLKIKARLRFHPLLSASMKAVEARRRDVDISKQSSKAAYALEVSYAQRQDRPDFVSAGVAIKIPLFKRQSIGHQTNAAQSRVNAEVNRKDDLFVMMLRRYQDRLAVWNRLKQRYRSFKNVLIPRARSNARLTTSTYRNGQTDFSNMIRAQITALEIQLKATRIRIDLSKAHADMSYLAGEQK